MMEKSSAVSRELEYYKTISSADEDDPLARKIERATEVITAKSSAVLTHLSIMIAVTTGLFLFWFQGANIDFLDYILLGELCGYISLTLFALHGIFMTDHRTFSNGSDYYQRALEVIVARKRSLRIATRGTIWMTLFLLITIVLKILRQI